MPTSGSTIVSGSNLFSIVPDASGYDELWLNPGVDLSTATDLSVTVQNGQMQGTFDIPVYPAPPTSGPTIDFANVNTGLKIGADDSQGIFLADVGVFNGYLSDLSDWNDFTIKNNDELWLNPGVSTLTSGLSVDVLATDNSGENTVTQTFSLPLVAAPLTGVAISTAGMEPVLADNGSPTEVAVVRQVGGDLATTFSLAGPDVGDFSLALDSTGNEGLWVGPNVDLDSKASVSVDVIAADGGVTADAVFTSPVVQPPPMTGISLYQYGPIESDMTDAMIVGAIQAVGGDWSVAYSLSGPDVDDFSLTHDQWGDAYLWVDPNADLAGKASLSVEVTATDKGVTEIASFSAPVVQPPPPVYISIAFSLMNSAIPSDLSTPLEIGTIQEINGNGNTVWSLSGQDSDDFVFAKDSLGNEALLAVPNADLADKTAAVADITATDGDTTRAYEVGLGVTQPPPLVVSAYGAADNWDAYDVAQMITNDPNDSATNPTGQDVYSYAVVGGRTDLFAMNGNELVAPYGMQTSDQGAVVQIQTTSNTGFSETDSYAVNQKEGFNGPAKELDKLAA